jgi:hypothetical protein
MGEFARDAANQTDEEWIGFFDAEGQLVFDPKVGLPDRVRLTAEEETLARGMRGVHNHPSGLPFSFSDVESSANLALEELWAACPDGTAFQMLAPMGGWPEAGSKEGWVKRLVKELADLEYEYQDAQLRRVKAKQSPMRGKEAQNWVWERASAIFASYSVEVERASVWDIGL